MTQNQDKAPNILELLDGLAFPVTREEIVDYASGNDASEEALEQLRLMPDQQFSDWEQINKNLAMIEGLPGRENQWSSHREERLYSPAESVATRVRGQGKVSR